MFGQYTSGTIDGAEVVGYRDEPDVASDSHAETYVATRLHIDTWRWQGVPFYIRTGKRLPRRLTQIAVVFRRPPVSLFESLGGCETHPNALVLTLQPDEGFALCVDVKVPAEPFALRTLPLRFHYKEAFGEIPDAYHPCSAWYQTPGGKFDTKETARGIISAWTSSWVHSWFSPSLSPPWRWALSSVTGASRARVEAPARRVSAAC